MKRLVLSFIAVGALLEAGQSKPVIRVSVPSTYRNLPADAGNAEVVTEWWCAFGDPLLDELMERAATANLDVRLAGARLVEVRAARLGARAALLPQVELNTAASRLRGGFNQGVIRVPEQGPAGAGNFVAPFETSLFSAGAGMRWEADVWGGIRKAVSSATADVRSSEASLADVRSAVRAELALHYIALRAAEDQIAIVRANIASEEDLLSLLRARAEAGLASELDVERQVSLLASVRAALPALDAERLTAAHRISVLTGAEPSALLDRLSAAAGTPLRKPDVPAAVPGDLLRQRPDIRRALADIEAAQARAGAARSDLYPKFVITGLSGRQSTDFSGFTVGAGNFFAFGPGVSLPLFNFGRIRSNIAAQDARAEQTLHSFEKSVLSAVEETENALIAHDRANARKAELERALEAARRSVDMAQELYLRGLGDFLAVLDAQRQLFLTEREIAAASASVLRAVVALHRALGG